MNKILLIFVMFFSMDTFADLYCGGKVLGVYVSATSDVIIKGDWKNDWTRICNLKSDPTVDVVTCSLWASYAASALQNNISVLLLYPTGVSQCTSIPTYNAAPTPYYFMLTK